MRPVHRAVISTLALPGALLVVSKPSNGQTPRRPDSIWTRDKAAPALALERARSSALAEQPHAWLPAELEPGVPAHPLAARKDREAGLTLMIVGGAMFVSGLIIGDTGGVLLAVAGVGIGAYGVYLSVP